MARSTPLARAFFSFLGAGSFLLLTPAPAEAASFVSNENGTLHVVGGQGFNSIEASEDASYVYFADYEQNMTPGPGCEQTQFVNNVRCTRSQPITNVLVELGDGDDEMSGDHLLSYPVEVHGGPGNDAWIATVLSLTFFGEDGDDTVSFPFASAQAQLTVDGGSGNDQITGGPRDDTLLGGADNDRVVGAAGKDKIGGGPGDDVLLGGDGADKLSGQDGKDLLKGGRGKDRLRGQGGADRLKARDRKKDRVSGGPGHDRATVDEEDHVSTVEVVLV